MTAFPESGEERPVVRDKRRFDPTTGERREGVPDFSAASPEASAASAPGAPGPGANDELVAHASLHGDLDASYSFKFLTNELRRHDKICGYVYTELTDVEWEHNGFLNYDRTPKELGYDAFLPDMRPNEVNGSALWMTGCEKCRRFARSTLSS